jgi:competence protein ComEA
MKTSIVLAMMLAFASPVLAQAPAPAAQPSAAGKAVEAAGSLANKVLGTTPAATPAPAASKVAVKAPLININTATPAQIDALPQIGDARTKAIIAGRPYKASQELVDRKIIPANAYDAIKDKIAVK